MICRMRVWIRQSQMRAGSYEVTDALIPYRTIHLHHGARGNGEVMIMGNAAAALARYPDLHFGPDITVATGAGSLALVYRSVEGLLAVETLLLNDRGLVACAHCHYRSTAPGESTVGAFNDGD